MPHAGAEDDGEDEDDEPDEDEGVKIEPKIFAEKPPRAASAEEKAVLEENAREVLKTPVPAPQVEAPVGARGGSGLVGVLGTPPATAPPPLFLPPMKGPSGGSTPERIGPTGGGGFHPGFPRPGPALPALLLGALATAAVIFKAGPPPLRAAAFIGPFALQLELSQLESAFTALMGILEGRFDDPREAQVERPARGFLVDLSQMFVPPPPEQESGDVAAQPF